MKPPTVQELIPILWRRKLWVLVPVFLGLVGGYTATQVIPPTYRSSAQILIEPPKVADGLVQTITSLTQAQRSDAVRKHIRARDRIERLVTDLELYPELSRRGEFALAVQKARNALVVRVGSDRAVRIEFTGADPEKVATAVNLVADEYVATNSALRDVESEGTIDFMQSQLEKSKSDLEAHEALITRFKAENLMRLPEQRESHSRALESLETKRASNDDAIASAERRLILLRQGIRPVQDQTVSPEAELLEQRRQDLRALRRDFTEQHPDVIRLKKEVAALEEEVAGAPATPAPVPDTTVDPLLAAELAQIEFVLEDLRVERQQIQTDIFRYRSYLEQIPAVEQQLLILNREHDNLRGFFGQNLKRRTEIGVAEDLEKGDLRATMSVFERAVPAGAPYSPNKPFLMMAGLGLGGILGLGLALLREHASGSFEGPEELKRAFPGVRVLNPIPRIRASEPSSGSAGEEQRRSA